MYREKHAQVLEVSKGGGRDVGEEGGVGVGEIRIKVSHGEGVGGYWWG